MPLRGPAGRGLSLVMGLPIGGRHAEIDRPGEPRIPAEEDAECERCRARTSQKTASRHKDQIRPPVDELFGSGSEVSYLRGRSVGGQARGPHPFPPL